MGRLLWFVIVTITGGRGHNIAKLESPIRLTLSKNDG